MVEVVVVCEGQTEEAFVEGVLASALATRGVYVLPRLIATSPVSKGGSLSRQRVLRALRRILRERRDTYVTTFFDLYALTPDFPGRSDAASKIDPLERSTAIESELHRVVVRDSECRPDRFFPHIQPHEFEALLFSDVETLSGVEPEWGKFSGKLADVRGGAQSPEHINDGPNTHPSAQLLGKLRPMYDKPHHGTIVPMLIGLERIRAECRHFDGWLKRIENLSPIRKPR